MVTAAIALIGAYEGLRTVAYRDSVNVPTICFGETRGVKMGDRHTVEECKEMFGVALLDFEKGMRRCLTNPDAIPDSTYIVFLSFAYNAGTGNFCKSSVARLANAGNLAGACNALLAWNRAGGRVLPGLTRRRKEERALCLKGVREKVVTVNAPVKQEPPTPPPPDPAPPVTAVPVPPPATITRVPVPDAEESSSWWSW